MSVRTIDALGTYCPVPIHLVARAITTVEPGEAVTVLADDPLVEVDLPAWCHQSGNELVELVADGSEYRGIVRRTPRAD